MKVGFYGHVRQYHNLKEEIDSAMQEVLESGKYVQGPMLQRFEEELKAYTGAKYAIGVGNGTDALWLTYMALGLGEGDEMITHANTFFATAEAMWIAGCTAVLVDCDEGTWKTLCGQIGRDKPVLTWRGLAGITRRALPDISTHVQPAAQPAQ